MFDLDEKLSFYQKEKLYIFVKDIIRRSIFVPEERRKSTINYGWKTYFFERWLGKSEKIRKSFDIS